jgi:hypothetical protein
MRDLKIDPSAELFKRLRRCGTTGDAALRPYEAAAIAIESVPIADIVPLSKYVLADQLGLVNDLRRELSELGVDVFELAEGIVWPHGPNERPIACPIIEVWDGEGLLLVDGIHRVWSARQEGRTKLICAVIKNVVVPLVPVPVTWNDVKVYPPGHGPAEDDKREYRFSNAGALRTAFPPVASQVTEDNFRYFLFRTLDELGSSGIRTPAKQGARSISSEQTNDQRS